MELSLIKKRSEEFNFPCQTASTGVIQILSLYRALFNQITLIQFIMKEHLPQSIKKLKILQDKFYLLIKLRKTAEAKDRIKKLFHLQCSFCVILLLNKNYELFEPHFEATLKSLKWYYTYHPTEEGLLSKKQLILFNLISYCFIKTRKYQNALSMIFISQTVASYLDDSVERNCDFLLAINFFTAYLLQTLGKLKESLNFISVAERVLHKLLVTLKSESKSAGLASNRGGVGSSTSNGLGATKLMEQTSLELINEEGNTGGLLSPNESPKGISKKKISEDHAAIVNAEQSKTCSQMTKTLLSNYLLGLSLMKNIALKFTNPVVYQNESMAQISRILEIESRYSLNNSAPEIGISFLVNQHIKEILEKHPNPADVVQLTFTREFNNMLQVCLFIPFLHPDTPRPISIPKSELKLDFLKPKPELLASVLSLRQSILQNTQYPPNGKNPVQTNLLMTGIPELASYREEEEDEFTSRLNKAEKLSDLSSKNHQQQYSTIDQYSQLSQKLSSKANSDVEYKTKQTFKMDSEEEQPSVNVGPDMILASSKPPTHPQDNQRRRILREMGQSYYAPKNKGQSQMQSQIPQNPTLRTSYETKPKSSSTHQRVKRNMADANSTLSSIGVEEPYGSAPTADPGFVNYHSSMPRDGSYTQMRTLQARATTNLNNYVERLPQIQKKVLPQSVYQPVMTSNKSALIANSHSDSHNAQLFQTNNLTQYGSFPSSLGYQAPSSVTIDAQPMNKSAMSRMKQQDAVESYAREVQTNLLLRHQIDQNIQSILDKSQQSFSLLYNHPKLINQVFNRQKNIANQQQQRRQQKALILSSNNTGKLHQSSQPNIGSPRAFSNPATLNVDSSAKKQKKTDEIVAIAASSGSGISRVNAKANAASLPHASVNTGTTGGTGGLGGKANNQHKLASNNRRRINEFMTK